MKISILSPDLSHNCLGRAYLLAKILQRHYEVEIVGPVFGEGVWEPVAGDKSITYKSVKMHGSFIPYFQIRELIKKIDGDVIYASKPLFTSFGIGLLKKVFKEIPLILDIDDWQEGFTKEYYSNLSFLGRFQFLVSSAIYFYNPSSYWNSFFGEKLSHFANKITVSNNFLKEKFDGTIVYHGRDTEAFNPEKFQKYLIREKYEIEKGKKVVMFLGSPRVYKGVEDLIKAVGSIKNRDIVLVVVGMEKSNYCQNLVKFANSKLHESFKEFDVQPFEKVPEFLAMADVIVIPLRKNSATIGQLPAKVFDAMAMAKPIVATDVSDLPQILEGCGWIVEPANPRQLAETIEDVLDNPDEAVKRGKKAREKCIAHYDCDAVEKILVPIFRKYE